MMKSEKIHRRGVVGLVVLAIALALMLVQLAIFTPTAEAGVAKITICHIPPGNPANAHEITIGEPAVATHLARHGDFIGPCNPGDDDDDDDDDPGGG